MTEEKEVPVSITYTGETMQRQEVVDYLEQYIVSYMAYDQFSLEKEQAENKIKALKQKYDESSLKAPSDMPPKRSYTGEIGGSVLVVLIGRGLFGLFSVFWFRAVVLGVVALWIWLMFDGGREEYKKECENWKKAKEEYTEKKKWLEEQKKTYKDGKPPELLAAEEELQNADFALKMVDLRCKSYEAKDVLPKPLREWPIPVELYGYFSSGRVNTLSEAINLFHAECHNQRMLQLQEEMRTRQEAMIMQQNLNAARLSEQINTAKNEIEMDNFIQSCFVQDRLDSIYREVLDQR